MVWAVSLWVMGASQNAPLNSIATIENDMKLPHSAKLSGVPDSYDWSKGPRVGFGLEPGQFRAWTPWGQLYVDAGHRPPSNTRVQIRKMRGYLFSKSQMKWVLSCGSDTVEGGAYREDFVDDTSKPAEVRPEATGGISVVAGNGFNYHFWPTKGRQPIEPSDLGGVFVTFQGRLILDDPTKPDDRGKARYLLGAGADYWLSLNAVWDHFKTNGDVGLGRLKRVTSQWQAFNMAVPIDLLQKTPPPLE